MAGDSFETTSQEVAELVSSEQLLENLTDAQRQAVTHVEGPLLVLAGPGSGKTRVITSRVGYLIGQGVRPWNILAITFTNKAAKEMATRLAAMDLPRGATICTFHSLAARLLREFSERAGLPANFSIYDESDQAAVMRDVLRQLDIDSKMYPPGRALARIGAWKNDLQTPDVLAPRADEDFRTKKLLEIYRAYEKKLADNAALDFDDLLVRLALLLRDDSELREHLNQRFRYVLVDEYQDTNHCQYQIARGLTLSHRNLCATGDPDQSIYAWRGADIGNILAFEEDYPETRVVRLEENFRSTPEVLALADELIRCNARRKHKALFTSRPGGTPPVLIENLDEYAEARQLVEWVRAGRAQGLAFRDLAVFYRVNWMSRILEDALRRAGTPYQILRGVEFYRRAEVKDMLSYLRLLVNPSDRVALLRAINRPTRGLGQTTVNRLLAHADTTGQDLWHVLAHPQEVPNLAAAAVRRIKPFIALIATLRATLGRPVADIIRATYEQSGLANALKAENEEAAENLQELIHSAAEYDASTEKPDLAEYLQQVALVSDQDAYDEHAGAVSLMTLHAAKGLEFPAVFIAGVEDGLIPHSRSINDDAALEEERRLLFVGMTRAKKSLTLSYARSRTVQGASMATIKSEFLRPLRSLEFLPCERDWTSPETGFDDDQAYRPVSPHLRYHDKPKASRNRPAPRPEPKEKKSNIQVAAGFAKGQQVRHPKFGLGKIICFLPGPEGGFVDVQFNMAGKKTLALKYARLEPAGTK